MDLCFLIQVLLTICLLLWTSQDSLGVFPSEDVLELGQKCSWLYEWNPRHFRASAGACDSEPQGKETVYWHHVIAKTLYENMTSGRKLGQPKDYICLSHT